MFQSEKWNPLWTHQGSSIAISHPGGRIPNSFERSLNLLEFFLFVALVNRQETAFLRLSSLWDRYTRYSLDILYMKKYNLVFVGLLIFILCVEVFCLHIYMGTMCICMPSTCRGQIP